MLYLRHSIIKQGKAHTACVAAWVEWCCIVLNIGRLLPRLQNARTSYGLIWRAMSQVTA
jgi:hypothetical protein